MKREHKTRKVNNKAVVLGTNYYIGLAVVRSLGRKGIRVVSIDHGGINHYGKSKYVSEAYIAPHYSREETGFLNFLLDYGRKQELKPVLFPTADLYVAFMDKHFDALKEYYLFPMDRSGLLTALMDKSELTRMAEEFGLKTPERLDISEDDLYQKVKDQIGYPLIVKPDNSADFVSHYHKKVFFINDESELKEKIAMTRMDGHDVSIQRIIPGPEKNNYNFDCYVDRNGRMAYYTTEQKIRQWPNNFGASTLADQRWIKDAADFSIPFIKWLNYKGFIEIEMKRDSHSGQIYLMEANVRYVNFTQLHVAIGMDTPYLTYLDCTGQDIGEKIIDYDTGKRWRYLYEDIPAIKGYLRSGQMTKDEIRSDKNYDEMISAIWSFDDPIPGIVFFLSHAYHKIRKVLGIEKKS